MAPKKKKTGGRARKKARAPGRRALWWRLLRWPVRLVFLGVALAVGWVALYSVINPPIGVYMASEWIRLGTLKRDWVDIDEISPHLTRAVMAGEDARFCDHNGFDLDAIEAALEANAEGKRVLGGSTITQQVAKNVFLWHARSWLRKGLEAGFAILIEWMWSKQRILEVYLNSVEFAEGVFGAEAAARHHFGQRAAVLSLQEASRLAAVLPSPKTRDAGNPSRYIRQRGRSIAAGANTLAAEGRDTCAFKN